MKIKTKQITWAQAETLRPPKKQKLKKPNPLFGALIRLLSIPDMLATRFTYTKAGVERAGKGPKLILMNHSSFIDLKIASKILWPNRYFIVCTSDGFIGKNWLMRQIGCIPTKKFTADVGMTRDVLRAVKELKTSVLIFPEASYTFDGTATPLPRKLGAFLKKLDVPVMTIITDGAFLRQPLYNDLRLRKVKTSAHYQCLLTREEIAEKSVEELDEILDKTFSFDNFASQWKNKTTVADPHRAAGLHRVLYQCPNCKCEGQVRSEGKFLWCEACGKKYEMDEYGRLHAVNGETEFSHIPDWFAWQRANVRKEIEAGEYKLNLHVNVAIMNDFDALYLVGEGSLTHDKEGFVLKDDKGETVYTQTPLSSYSLYSDYNWYELGDVICVGDNRRLYYCFPKEENVVTKARFAAEELYKLQKSEIKK